MYMIDKYLGKYECNLKKIFVQFQNNEEND